jgi:hypothetical protein
VIDELVSKQLELERPKARIVEHAVRTRWRKSVSISLGSNSKRLSTARRSEGRHALLLRLAASALARFRVGLRRKNTQKNANRN